MGPGLKSSELHNQRPRRVSLHDRKWKSAGTVWFLCLLLEQIQTQLKAGAVVPGCSSLMQLLPLLQLSATAPAQSPRHWELGSMVQWCSKATELPWKCLQTAPAILLQAGSFVPAFMPCLSLQRTLVPPCHSCMGAGRSSREHEHQQLHTSRQRKEDMQIPFKNP